MTARGLSVLVLLIGLVLVALVGWPTRYEKLQVGPETGGHRVRVDRFSGERFVRVESGAWISIDAKPSLESTPAAGGRPDLPAVPSSPGDIQRKGQEIRDMHKAAQEAMDQGRSNTPPPKPR